MTGTTVPLERVPLTGSGAGQYNEDWLQDLLFRHPEALPIAEINDSFSGLIPICRELSTPAGPVDVLYATSAGRIAVLEAKLWRNPEARRTVVGQILDYAKELSTWTYDTLDAAVRAASRRDRGEARSLFDAVRAHDPGLDEARFVDAVSRSLRRGELLLLIVGDGIRENVGAITNFIENHGTLHFTFGLVELAIYQMPDGSRLIHPRILAQTSIVSRIVVSLRDGQLVEEDPDEGAEDPSVGVRPDLEEQRRQYREFWEEFMKAYPLDDSSQPVRPPTSGTNQFYYMPKESEGWICAVAARASGQAGVYLALRRGPISDRIYQALSEDRAAIDEAIGHPVKWSVNDKWQTVSIWREYGPQMLTDRRAQVQAWLGELLNRFVNAFRPRIESLLKEQ